MPIISNFPSGGGGGSGITLSAVKNVEYRTASQKVYIKWTDPEDLVDSSGSTLATWAGTLLVRKKDGVPKSRRDGVVVIDSSIRNAYSEAEFCDNISLENESKYFYKFFPYTTEKAYTNSGDNNFDATPDYIVIENEPMIKDDSFVYNGTEFAPEFIYDSDKVIIGGTTGATDAGSYTTEFTPDEDYCWSDGGRETKTLVWVINKADSNISISPTEVRLVGGTESETISINTISDGEIIAVSNDTTIATVEVNQSTKEVIITKNSNDITGDTQVTISVTETKNFNASSVTCCVNVSFELDSYSWGEISEISKSGRASEYFQVGDTKSVNIDGEDYEVRIIGFDHDTVANSEAYGREIAGMTLQLVDVMTDSVIMSTPDDNNNAHEGWESSSIRGITLPRLLNEINQDLTNVITPVMKGCSSGSYYNTPEIIEDTLFLLSEYEIFGNNIYSSKHEIDMQYEYFKNNEDIKSAVWWTRSPLTPEMCEYYLNAYYDSTSGDHHNYNGFCIVEADTNNGIKHSYSSSNAQHSISFAFCV